MQRSAISPTDPALRARRFLDGRLSWWIRGAVTVILAIFLVRRAHEELSALQLHLAHPIQLALAAGVATLAVCLSAWMWYILIPPADRIAFRQTLAQYVLGHLWNSLLPGGMGGDVVRAAAFRNASGRGDIAVSSVLMARLCSLWAIVLTAAAASLLHLWYPGGSAAPQLPLLAAGALVLAAGGTAFLLAPPLSALMRRLPDRLHSWHACLRAYRGHPAQLLQALGWALTIQLCAVAINRLVAGALDLPVTTGQLLISVPLITLTAVLPISLGGFGVREVSYMVVLGLVGVPAGDAILLAVAVFALLTLVTAAGAGICRLLVSPPERSP
ncbi:MAG: hypothetical protein GQ526_02780 [Ardenticatenales bacterium]|nr:hypothetical protein [Ardenticatenales bacterium]